MSPAVAVRMCAEPPGLRAGSQPVSPLPAGLLRPDLRVGTPHLQPSPPEGCRAQRLLVAPRPSPFLPGHRQPGPAVRPRRSPGGAARGAVGPGADACEGAGPWATSSSQGATRQGPEPGQDRARVGPQRPAICQPAPAPGSPEGGLCTSLGTPASPGTAPQRWPVRGWICGGRGARGPGGARVSRQSPARPCWSSSNTGPRGASPAPIPPAPSRSPVPRGRGAAEPAERQIRGGRDGCRGPREGREARGTAGDGETEGGRWRQRGRRCTGRSASPGL